MLSVVILSFVMLNVMVPSYSLISVNNSIIILLHGLATSVNKARLH